MVKPRSPKSGSPNTAAMTGVMRSRTRAVTTVVNAAPMTTATARSTTLPRRMKARNSLRISGVGGMAAKVATGPVAPGGARAGGTLDPPHGPLALLRRHRRLGAHGPSRPSRDAAAPRGRPPAVRLRRRYPAPAPAHGGAARHAGRLPHPP